MREVESRHKGRFLLGLVLPMCAFAAMELAARGASTSTATLNACRQPERVAALYTTGQGSTPCLGWGLEAPDARAGSTLSGVDAIGPDDVWAVGRYPDTVNGTLVSRTFVEHWNGTAWTRIVSPNGSDRYNALNAVAAVSSTDVWAVGQYEDNSAIDIVTIILHWDGTAWTRVPSPDTFGYDDYLYSVTATSANDVWAVGTYGENEVNYNHALVLHWDGTAWSQVSIPDVGNDVNSLRAVAGTDQNDVWAVGHYYDHGGPVHALILHWNGTAWSPVSIPDMGPATYLLDAAALATNDVWAVGTYYNGSFSQTLVLHWDGTAWSPVPTPNLPGDSQLRGISAVSPDDIWAAGGSWTPVATWGYALTMHWDGAAWPQVYTPTPGSQDTPSFVMNDVDASATDDVWAVGYFSRSSNVYPLIEHYSDPTTACTMTFTDVPPGSTFFDYVRCMACRGVVSGYACGGPGEPCDPNNNPYFRPNSNITRGQLAKIVAVAAVIENVPGPRMFEDVPPGSTFYEWVQALALRDYISGYACGGDGEPCVPPANWAYFRPGASATRGQIAKIVSNVARLYEEPSPQMFEDVPPGSTFFDWVQRLAHRGAISGYPCGGLGEPCGPEMRPYFRPGNNTTRGQLSKIASAAFFNGGGSVGSSASNPAHKP